MTETIIFENTKIAFTTIGKGQSITLIHGYLESKEIWNELALELSKNFSVCLIDLPGHGESESFFPANTMELMASAVNRVLEKCLIQKTFLVGHSMGGYVSMAFAEKFPEKLWALSLFHSAPYADNDEKKKNRDREINLLLSGKKKQIYSQHFPKVFANKNVEQFTNEIEQAKQHAQSLPENYIIATLKGMKMRSDKTKILSELKVPFLYFAGKYDNFIPFEMKNILPYPKQYHIIELENSGHIGFIEEKQKTADAINAFARIYL